MPEKFFILFPLSKLKEEDCFSNTPYYPLHSLFPQVNGNGKEQRSEIIPLESPLRDKKNIICLVPIEAIGEFG
jgi:hypothetical protein